MNFNITAIAIILRAIFKSAVLLGLLYFLKRSSTELEAIKVGSMLIMVAVLFTYPKDSD
jgi:hypothetical protein